MIRRIIPIFFLVVVVVGLCSCSKNETKTGNHSDKITIDNLLAIESKEDAKKLLGRPKNAQNDSYDIKFMGNEVLLLVDYSDSAITDISLGYFFEGINNAGMSASEILSYQPSRKDIQSANRFLDVLIADFTEKFGNPQIFNSPVNTTTYTWFYGENEIEVQDNINSDIGVMGAIDIRIKYGKK